MSRDPAIGLKLSAEYELERFNPTAIAAVCSRTFGDAVERMGRSTAPVPGGVSSGTVVTASADGAFA